jgi:hypothetical protein
MWRMNVAIKEWEGKGGTIRMVEEGEEERIGQYNSTGGIAHVMSLKKGDRKVDIILSERRTSIYPSSSSTPLWSRTSSLAKDSSLHILP